MEIYEDIEKKIRKAMREQGTYSKAMEISISLAAGSYMAYLKAGTKSPNWIRYA